MNWFLLLKTIHVLSAIVAVGSNATYGLWSARGRGDASHLGFALRGIKFIDDRMANPAYGLLLVTGLIMAVTTYRIGLTWILIGLGLFAVLVVIGAGFYTPALKRQITALDVDGPAGSSYRAAEARATAVGIFLGVVAVVAVVDMVFKPQF